MNKPTSRPAAAMPLDVDLPERVIDQLVADSGFTYQDPDEQDVYALARAIKAEVLARIPRSALAVPQPVGDLHAEHWRLLTELPTKSERYPVAHRGGIGGHAYFVTEADARPSLPAGWQQMPDWGPTHWCDAPGRHAAAALVAAPQPVARVLRPVARVEQRNYFPTVAASRASPSLMWMIPYPEVRQIPDGTVLYAIPLADASAQPRPTLPQAPEPVPNQVRVDRPDGVYAADLVLPGDAPGPADVRRVVNGYVYWCEPRSNRLHPVIARPASAQPTAEGEKP